MNLTHTMMQNRTYRVLTGILFLVTVLLLTALPAKADTKRTALEGIFVDDIAVGGMTEEEIFDTLNSRAEGLRSTILTVEFAGNSYQFQTVDVGFSWSNLEVVGQIMHNGTVGNVLQRFRNRNKVSDSENVFYTMTYSVDEGAIRNMVESNLVPMNSQPVNYELVLTESGPSVAGGSYGYTVNVDAAVSTITDFLVNQWRGGDAVISVPYDEAAPQGDYELLSRCNTVIGSYETDFTGSIEGRITNLKNAISKINGTILYPGDKFSVLDAVMPFTIENGYAWSTAYELGMVIDDIGGGTCQVSSTLYNAVLQAELKVISRSEHSMVVGYVKPSMDAAVSEGGKDFVFQNDTNAPIYIYGYSYDHYIGFILYGEETRPANREVVYESVVLSETPVTSEIYEKADMPFGYLKIEAGHIGQEAELYKVVKVDGVEVSRTKVNKSTYKVSNIKVYVGTKTSNEEAKAAMYAAMETKDGNQMQAVIDQYGSEYVEEKKE